MVDMEPGSAQNSEKIVRQGARCQVEAIDAAPEASGNAVIGPTLTLLPNPV